MIQSGQQRLDSFERALRYLIETCGLQLGYLQVKLMDKMRNACLARMFGDTLEANAPYLQNRFGISTFNDVVNFKMPPNSGKTTVSAIAAACIAVSQPDGNCTTFSLTDRQSAAWLRQCMGYLEIFRTSDEFGWTEVSRKMPERIAIRSEAAGTVNTISAYLGTQVGSFENLRGMGFKLCANIFENVELDVRGMPVLLPLLANGAALILISSDSTGKELVDRDKERTKALLAPFADAYEREMKKQ